MQRLLVGFALVLLSVSPVPAQEGTRPIEPADYYRVQRVGDTSLSPDGRHLLYTVETVRQEQNDRITHVWWTDLETGQNQRLSTAGVSSTNPGWTPDGRRVHFTTTRGGETGIHFINFAEPGGEAFRIRGIPNNPNFSRDGSWVLVTRQVTEDGEVLPGGGGPRGWPGGGPGGPGAAPWAREGGSSGERSDAGRAWPTGTPALTGPSDPSTRGQTEEERNNDVYVITHASYKRDGQLGYVPPTRQDTSDRAQVDRFTQFFRVPADGLVEGQELEQLTFDPVDKSFQEFSPDGRWIVYTVDLSDAGQEDDARPEEDESGPGAPEDDEAPMPEIGIYQLPVDGGEATQIATVTGSVREVRMSPDRERVAVLLVLERQADPLLWVLDSATGERIAEIGADWVYSITSPTWSADGRELLWTSAIGGRDQVVKVQAVDGSPVTRVTDGRHTLGSVSFDANMQQMAYVKSTADRPWEAFVANVDGTDEQQVSRVNDEWLSQVRLSQVERFTFEGVSHNEEWLTQLKEKGVEYMLANDAPDGVRPEIEAWLVYPIDYEPGHRYPMTVSIHGGPHSRYAETWFHEFQMIAAEGIFVLYTNPRGSSSYGREFMYMTMEAWGIDDAKDILRAVDIVVDRGIVDAERIGVQGGSYGGFMTNWLTAHDQRWRTAITDRSISNWISFYGVSDASGLVEREFGGMIWPFNDTEEGSFLLATMLSPIVWADRVRTPTLIIHSINDYRTPLEGAEQWYRALQKHGVPVKMVLFPDTSHGLSRTGEPWLLVRRLNEYVDWLRDHLVEVQPPAVADDAG